MEMVLYHFNLKISNFKLSQSNSIFWLKIVKSLRLYGYTAFIFNNFSSKKFCYIG